MDPIPTIFTDMLRTECKDSSKNLSSPFMKTKAYKDIEKLYDQNGMKYRLSLSHRSNMGLKNDESNKNLTPLVEEDEQASISHRVKIKKLRN